MAFVRNPSDILHGTGRLFINGIEVGQVGDDVGFSHSSETDELEANGETILVLPGKESSSVKFELHEANLATLMRLNPDRYKEVSESPGTETISDALVESLSASRQSYVGHTNLSHSATITAKLASKLAAGVLSGATKIYVANAAKFTAGDSVRIRYGSTTENATIAADGVNLGENSITLTAALTNAYPSGAVVVDTTLSIAEGTDYFIDRMTGAIYRDSGSTALTEGLALAVSYTRATYSGYGFSYGGGTGESTLDVMFIHKRRDGKYRVEEVYKAVLKGDLLRSYKAGYSSIQIELSAEVDSTKTVGNQIGKVMDYEAAAVPGGGW